MKATWQAIAMALLLLSAFGSAARADLFPADDSRFGTGALTVDTRTGLTWLDLPFTSDFSYLEAEAAVQPGGQIAGFRHATAEEVLSLYNSAGFRQGFVEESSPSFESVVSLIALVVPEPSASTLSLAAGVLTLLWRRRKA